MVKVDLDLSGMKIPKKVAGMKVPKKLRKRGKALLAKAGSPAGREAIAAGLTIAGAAIAATAQVKAAKRARATERDEAAATLPPGQPGIDPSHDLSDAITAGIGALQRFLSARG